MVWLSVRGLISWAYDEGMRCAVEYERHEIYLAQAALLLMLRRDLGKRDHRNVHQNDGR